MRGTDSFFDGTKLLETRTEGFVRSVPGKAAIVCQFEIFRESRLDNADPTKSLAIFVV